MRFLCYTDFGHQGASSGRTYLQTSCFPTVVNHLQVERLPFVHVVQVFYGNDEAELQDGQTWERTDQPSDQHLRHAEQTSSSPCSMFALASMKQKRLASSRTDALMVGLETETRLRQNSCGEERWDQASAGNNETRSEEMSEEEEAYQQTVQRAEIDAGDEMSVKNLPD